MASFQAIHDSSAHFTREGNFATPANAIAVLQDLFVRLDGALALHQGQELAVHLHRVVDGLADHQVGHHRRGGLRDGAAHGVVRHVLDDPVAEVDPQGHLVATRGVDVVHLRLEGLTQPLVVGVLVVVQDDLLVQRVEVHHFTST